MLSAVNQIYLRALFLTKKCWLWFIKKDGKMSLEFPQCHEWANKDDGVALCLERDVITARVSCDLGWRGDRSNGPSSVLAIRFLSHSCLKPEEFCKDQIGFLQHPTAATTPAPDTLSVSSPWLLPEVIEEQKTKQKQAKGPVISSCCDDSES